MRTMKKTDGFTLVELIVVIAILAILAAVAIPAYSGYIEKANTAADEQLLVAINKAFTSACLERGYDYTKAAASFKVDADGKLEKTNNMYIENFMLAGSDAAAKGNVDSSFADYYAGNNEWNPCGYGSKVCREECLLRNYRVQRLSREL